MESLFLIGSVIALTQFLKLLRAKDYWSAANIVAAAALGALVGFLGLDGVSLTDGIMGGLAAAGVITTAGAVRPKNGDVTVQNVETANVDASGVK